jgi:hypothetical protein
VSYFVIPFQSHARTWVTIGMEAVVAQAFQAVYPVSHGFVFAYPDERAEASRAIRRLADDLRAGEYGRHAARTLTFGDHLRRADDSMLDAAMLNGGSRPVEGGTAALRPDAAAVAVDAPARVASWVRVARSAHHPRPMDCRRGRCRPLVKKHGAMSEQTARLHVWAGTTEWMLLGIALQVSARVYCSGPPGIGKSFLAANDPRPAYPVTLSDDLTVQDLVGHYLPDGNKFVWHDGPVAMAMKEGARLILNELHLGKRRGARFPPGRARSTGHRRHRHAERRTTRGARRIRRRRDIEFAAERLDQCPAQQVRGRNRAHDAESSTRRQG